jgi:hypothetical protein
VTSHVFAKLYGNFRTGTNWLTKLIHKNFSDIVVIQHMLGSKHEQPISSLDSWRKYLSEPENSTFRAENAKKRKQIHLRELPISLQHELADKLDDLRYLVLIKNPYSWAASYARFKCGVFQLRSIWYIRRNSDNYRQWEALCETKPDRALIIRYEDLLTIPSFEMSRIAALAGYAHWDQSQFQGISDTILKNGCSGEPFTKAEYFLSGEYAEDLPDWVKQYVTDHTDWELFGRYGYTPGVFAHRSL